MTKIKILFLAILLSLISCSPDESPVSENPTGETPTEESPASEHPTGENPQAENCTISTITYGLFSGDRNYTATYSGENLTRLTSDEDEFVFTYNSNNQLITKEKFENGDSQASIKQEFSYNSNGQVIEQKNWDAYSADLIYVGKDTFTYDGDKLIEKIGYDEDNTSIDETFVYEWSDDNPVKLSIYSDNDVLECETTIAYDLAKENKFNSTFPYFALQDIYDEDFQLYLFLGKNVITSTTNPCSGDTDNYNMTLQSNGLLDTVKINGDLLWDFEYGCE